MTGKPEFTPIGRESVSDVELLPRRFEAFAAETKTAFEVVHVKLDALRRIGEQLELLRTDYRLAAEQLGRIDVRIAAQEHHIVGIDGNLRHFTEELASRMDRIDAVASALEAIVGQPPVVAEPAAAALVDGAMHVPPFVVLALCFVSAVAIGAAGCWLALRA